jgi:hypothetical protein
MAVATVENKKVRKPKKYLEKLINKKGLKR